MCMSGKVMWVTLKKPQCLLLDHILPCKPRSRMSYGGKSCPCQSFTTAWLVVSSGWPCIPNQDLEIQYLTKSQEAGEYYYHCILPVLRLPQILWMPKVDIFWVEHTWLVTSPWGCSAQLVWVWVHLSWVWGVARSGQGLSGWQVPQCNKTLWCESKAARESKLQFRVTLRREYKAL